MVSAADAGASPPPETEATAAEPEAPAPPPPEPAPAPEVEPAKAARYGQALPMGKYVFPDGVRVRFGVGDGCDFDPSEPCPFGSWYSASAKLGDDTAAIAVRKRQVKLLGRTLEVVAKDTFVLRR